MLCKVSMIKKTDLSRCRQKIRQLLNRIEHLAVRSLFTDPLIHGSPATVFRKCGRPGCKCAKDDTQKHGPYKVIQVVRDGCSRQICLRKDQEEFWQLAKNYQYQTAKLIELKQQCQELGNTIAEVIHKRTMEFPHHESDQSR